MTLRKAIRFDAYDNWYLQCPGISFPYIHPWFAALVVLLERTRIITIIIKVLRLQKPGESHVHQIGIR